MTEPARPVLDKVLKVSELTRYLKYVLESDDLLSAVSVAGEISNLTRSPSGHVYFTLKDASSQVACVLFRRELMQQRATVDELRPGIAAVVHGYLTVYEPRGTFQVYVERVLPGGEGALFLSFEMLRSRLEAEGLFAAERKRALPSLPRKIALITSPGSQAYHDVLHRLGTQYPFVTVIEVGVSVQGDGAPGEMSMAIDVVNRLTDADLIMLVRGGGAPEELAAFNDERLARAIFASRVPIITGIGHETDHTIADYVADVRAATPSLAAAAAVPNLAEMMQSIGRLHGQMSQLLRSRLGLERRRIFEINRALLRASPATKVRLARQRAEVLTGSMARSLDTTLRANRSRLAALEAQLAVLDPLAILGRGYAVLTDAATGKLVARKTDLMAGQRLIARFADGDAVVRVEES